MTEPAREPWSIRRVLSWTAERLTRCGSASPRLDAEVLLAHCLDVDRVRLYTEHDKPLGPAELSRYRAAVRRRLAGEPVAYITGRREFWSLELAVDSRVLVPRPESELLVELALGWARRALARGEPLSLLDVGSGSGALAVALAHELRGAPVKVLASDVDIGAAQATRANAARHGLAVRVFCGDLLAALPGGAALDLVLANPPYIPTGELSRLMADVRDFEPRAALDGGPDGLAVVRRLVPQAARRLRRGGLVLIEIAAGQAEAVQGLLSAAGFGDLRIHDDLSGQARVVGGISQVEFASSPVLETAG